MPHNLSQALAPSFEGLPLTCLDDTGLLKVVQARLFEELAPASNFAKVIALDIIQVEVDIMRLRQAKADVIDGALEAELTQLFEHGRIRHSHHTHFTRRFQRKLVSDILRGRDRISGRVEAVLRYYGETLSGLRARAFRRHMDVSQKIDVQLERFERRRRNLRRDLDLYQSARAQLIEASRGDA